MKLPGLSAVLQSLFIFLPFLGMSQFDSISIKGVIVDDHNKPVVRSFIKIRSSKQVISYFNTGDTNYFAVKLPFKKIDSFFITVTHPLYGSVELERSVTGPITWEEVISYAGKMLTEVVIKAPPVWVRGDTTFYKVDNFKEVGSKKLKDVIVNMPGFEITDDGELLFKKQKVDKILISGEELFAEKSALLLNNIPIHVLNTVEAIENQNSSKLLHGLVNEKKVFVNLGLRQEKLTSVFGDLEVGLGNQKRYAFNPVLFSIHGKLKVGLINNWNSLGKGIGWRQENELKNNQVKLVERSAIRIKSLQLINDIDPSFYIVNRQKDNRLQLNMPIGKSLKTRTELNYISDVQRQESFYSLLYFSDTAFMTRNDSNAVSYSPHLFSINHTSSWIPGPAKELKADVNLYLDRSRGTQKTHYAQQGLSYSTSSDIENHWSSFSIGTEYLSRSSASVLNKLILNISHQITPQQINAYSNFWEKLAFLGTNNYNMLNGSLSNNKTSAALQWDRMIKTQKGLLTTSVVASWDKFGILTDYGFIDINDSFPRKELSRFNNSGHYTVRAVTGKAQTQFKFIQKPVSLNIQSGLTSISKYENQRESSYFSPTLRLELLQRRKIADGLTTAFSFLLYKKPQEYHDLSELFLPVSTFSFRQHVRSDVPVVGLSTVVSSSYDWPSNLINSNFTVIFDRNYRSKNFWYSYDHFVEICTDSITSIPTNQLNISSTTTMPLKFSKNLVTIFGGGISSKESLAQGNSNKSLVLFQHAFITVKKNWSKKYFIHLTTQYTSSKLSFPIANKFYSSTISTIKYSVRHSVTINKFLSVSLSNESLQTSASGSKSSFMSLLNAEANFSFPEKYSFVVKANNLLDDRGYYNGTSSSQMQTYFSLPFIRRNFFCSFRVEL